MDVGIKIILVVILPLMLLMAVIYGGAYVLKERSNRSVYEYEVSISPEGDISNFSVKVPFPANLSDGGFSAPLDWVTEIDEEENMLLIEADEMYGGSRNKVSLILESDNEINTWDPLKEEPVLHPQADFNECDPPSDSDAERCYTYNYTDIAVIYESEDETEIEIIVELSGMNRWWILEELENQYHDSLIVSVEGQGEDDIEYEAEGNLKAGIGDY